MKRPNGDRPGRRLRGVRRGVLTALLAIALVTTAGTGSLAPPQGEAENRPYRLVRGTPKARFSIVSYNIAHRIRDRRANKELRRLSGGDADIIGMQEMGGRRDAVENVPGWRSYVPHERDGQGAVPIMWRRKAFKRVGADSRRMTRETRIGASGAGPRRLKAKYVNVVELRHRKTGRELYVLNTHLVPSVQVGGGKPNRQHPKRLRMYHRHMTGLTRMVGRLGRDHPVFITGDYNVDYTMDSRRRHRLFPFANMRRVGAYASWRVLGQPRLGTHGDRLIDYVFILGKRFVTARSQRILRGYRSDHRPVIVSIVVGHRHRHRHRHRHSHGHRN